MDASAQTIATALWLILPEAVLIGVACILFLAAPFLSRSDGSAPAATATAISNWMTRVALVAIALAAFVGVIASGHAAEISLAASPFRHDAISSFVRLAGLLGGILFVLLCSRQFPERYCAELNACLLVILAGVQLVGLANDLVGLFLALELVSIPTYIMLYMAPRDLRSDEAAAKYFLLSVFSSALVLFGLSYLYGCVGSTNLYVIEQALTANQTAALPAILLVAVVMVVAGLGFRVTAAPFHFYAPDVFEGTQTSLAALLAYLPKIVGFVALIRLVGGVLAGPAGAGVPGQAVSLLLVVAAVTMLIGNLLALQQDNLLRLLAYSSIAHSGYMLVGLASIRAGLVPTMARDAVLFYLGVYGAMTVGFFALVIHLDRKDAPVTTVNDLAGLAQTHPWLALAGAVFLFSLTGLPPTAGFMGKLFIFIAAWEEGSTSLRLLALLMAVNAAIAGWYYLRLVSMMYLKPSVRPAAALTPTPALVGVAMCAVITIGLFVRPGILWSVVASFQL